MASAENEDFLSGAGEGAVVGAAAGASGGVIGALAGAGIGALVGGFSGQDAGRAKRRAKRKAEAARKKALANASIRRNLVEQQAKSLRSTGKNLSANKGTDNSKTVPVGSTPTSSARTGAIGSGVGSVGTF